MAEWNPMCKEILCAIDRLPPAPAVRFVAPTFNRTEQASTSDGCSSGSLVYQLKTDHMPCNANLWGNAPPCRGWKR
jgi:hypothetical protein